jgi:hypothetical protein
MTVQHGSALEEDVYDSASRLVLDHVHRESVEELAARRDIDRRSIGTALVAGIFLAAIGIPLHAIGSPPWLLTILFVVTAFLLGATAFLSLRILFAREVEGIEDSREFREAAEAILSSGKGETARKKLQDFVIDRAKEWESVNRAVHREIGDKASRLHEAQRLLLFAVLASVVTVIVSIFYLAAT